MPHRPSAALGILLALAAVALFTPIFAAGKVAGGAVPQHAAGIRRDRAAVERSDDSAAFDACKSKLG